MKVLQQEEIPAVVSVFAKERDEDYVRYRAEIKFEHWLMAGVPNQPDVIEAWMRTKAGITDTEELRQKTFEAALELFPDLVSPEMTYEQMVAATKQVADIKANVFKKTPSGELCIEERQIKAMLKEAVNIRFPKEGWGKTRKGPKNFLAERVFVAPRLIGLGRSEPDGRHMFVGHVSGPSGERSTLTHYDYADQPRLSFTVEILKDAEERGGDWPGLKDKWPLIWVTAEHEGLGALRSQGFGRFVVTRWKRE